MNLVQTIYWVEYLAAFALVNNPMKDKKLLQVTAGIIKKKELILCTRRASNRHLAGYWEFPGGKIEPGESAEVCLVRELKEELNIDVQVGDLFATNVYEYDQHIVELHAYWVTTFSGNLILKDHDTFLWLPLSALNTLKWAPADVAFIDKLVIQR